MRIALAEGRNLLAAKQHRDALSVFKAALSSAAPFPATDDRDLMIALHLDASECHFWLHNWQSAADSCNTAIALGDDSDLGQERLFRANCALDITDPAVPAATVAAAAQLLAVISSSSDELHPYNDRVSSVLSLSPTADEELVSVTEVMGLWDALSTAIHNDAVAASEGRVFPRSMATAVFCLLDGDRASLDQNRYGVMLSLLSSEPVASTAGISRFNPSRTLKLLHNGAFTPLLLLLDEQLQAAAPDVFDETARATARALPLLLRDRECALHVLSTDLADPDVLALLTHLLATRDDPIAALVSLAAGLLAAHARSSGSHAEFEDALLGTLAQSELMPFKFFSCRLAVSTIAIGRQLRMDETLEVKRMFYETANRYDALTTIAEKQDLMRQVPWND